MRSCHGLWLLLIGIGVTLLGIVGTPLRAAEEVAAPELHSWRLVSHDASVIARSKTSMDQGATWRSVGFGEALAVELPSVENPSVELPAEVRRATEDGAKATASNETLVMTGVTPGATLTSSQGKLAVGPGSYLSIADDRIELLAGSVRVSAADRQTLQVKVGERTELVKSSQAIKVAWPSRSQPPEVTVDTKESPAVQPPLGLGQLVIGDAQADSLVRLKVARYHVNVVLQPPMALVQIDQSFYNPYHSQQQGTFAFSLPSGASVSRFAMYVTPDELIEGEVIERGHAREVYDSIVASRRDPAILEEIGPNQFRMQVFPISGRDTKRILLDFTVPIEAVQGIHRFRLPLLADREPIWDFQLKGVVHGALPATVYSPTHRSLPLENDEANDEVRFRSEQRMFTPDSDFALTFRSKGEEPTLRRYVARPLLANCPTCLPSPAVSTATYSYFQAMLPATKGAADAAPIDLVILLDTATLVKQREQVRAWARLLSLAAPRTSRVRLACVDSVLRSLTTQWCAPGSKELDEGLSRLTNEFFLGEQRPAITLPATLELFARPTEEQAANPKVQDERRRLMLYVGPGFATTRWSNDAASPATRSPAPNSLDKKTDHARDVEQAMVEKLQRAGVRFAAVLTDDQRNSQAATREFAERSGGCAFDSSLSEQQARLMAWLANGLAWPVRVVSVKAADSDADDLFAPAAIFPGEPLRILGRCRRDITRQLADPMAATAEQSAQQQAAREEPQEKPQGDGADEESTRQSAQLLVQLEGEESPRVVQLNGPQKADDLFVGRLWAQARLQYLKRLEAADKDPVASNELAKFGVQRHAQSAAIRAQMIELSQEWSVLSPHTAFLVLESESDYAKYGFVRRARRQYWSPSGKELSEPLPPEWLAAVRPDASKQAKLAPEATSQLLKKVRKALADEQFQDAQGWLEAAARSPVLVQSEDYRRLQGSIQQGLVRCQLLERVSGRFPAFAPDRASVQALQHTPDSLLLGLSGSPKQKRLYDRLNKRVEPVASEITLKRLAEWAEQTTGIPIDFDKASLDALAIRLDVPLTPVAAGSFTLENYLYLMLDQFDLTLIEDDDRLLIMSQEDGHKRQQRIEYPVAGLVGPHASVPRERLELLASEQWRLLQHQKLLRKLERPVSFQFRDEPIESVLTQVAAMADVPLFVDPRGLENEGLTLEFPVTVRASDLPARKALERVCEHSLAISTRGEAVVVTSKERAKAWTYPRVHSVRGVLTETRRDSVSFRLPRASSQGIGGGMGGLGGGMGGMGGWSAVTENSASRMGIGADPEAAPDVPTADVHSPSPPAITEASPPRSQESSDLDTVSMPNGVDSAETDQSYSPDWDELTELVRNTVTRRDWEDAGGVGATAASPSTLDLVVLGTDRHHREVESLLARLRRESLHRPARHYVRLMRAPPRLPMGGFDLSAIGELLSTTTGKPSPGWEKDGGANNVELDWVRAMLVINADPRSHDEIHTLLTQLHRSRYEQLHGSRPWENSRSFLEASTEDAPTPQDSVQHAEELTLLKVRAPSEATKSEASKSAVSISEAWTYRRLSDQGPQRIEVVSAGEVVEVRFPSLVLRMDGRDGAIISPAIYWVQVGEWGEALRRLVDAYLPWMPHRTDEDLARRFDIVREREDAATLTLRFTPTRSLEVREDALIITYDKQTGRVVAMKAQGKAETLGLLERQSPPATKKSEQARVKDRSNVEFETFEWINAHGRKVVEWKQEALSAQRDLESLDGLQTTHAILDQRPNAGRSSRLALAWKALSEQKDAEAFLLFTDEIRERGPVVATCFLRAWCAQRAPEFRNRPEVLKDLEFVVKQGASPWAEQIRLAEFPVFTDSQLYELLSLMPRSRRSAKDEERLARLAWEAGLLKGGEVRFRDLPEDDPFSDERVDNKHSTAALQHIRAAIEKPGLAGCSWSALEFGVYLAMRTGQFSLARDWAVGRVDLGKDSAEQVGELAAEINRLGQREIAEKFLDAMLKHPHVQGWDRRVLLVQRAAWLRGMPRWRSLVESENASLGADGKSSIFLNASIDSLTRELTLSATPDEVTQLASLAKSPALRVRLLWLLGDMQRDVDRIYESTREGIVAKDWPRHRLAHRCERLLSLGASERVVTLLETLLRRDEILPPDVLAQLRIAYEALDRQQEAARTH
ncbi:MAG: VIT domain-containing protein [Pirellulales bacterium]